MIKLVRTLGVVFYFLGSFVTLEAQEFRLGIKKNKDSISYYVVNLTDQKVNAGAIICTWFHNTDEIVFWPADLGIGLGTVSVPGLYLGKNTQFTYRTTQRVSFDFDIYPGDSQEFVTVQNYSDKPQEVMCTNIRVFYFDTSGADREANVYPIDENPCPFKQVYILSNFSADGIRFWTTANRTLHASTTCTSGFDVVVLNRTTLNPTPVPGVTPLCNDGKKWTTFGHPYDEQVYYHFDFTDTTQIAQFVTFVNAIQSGDHVFFSHSSRNFIDFTDQRVVNALKTLGGASGFKGVAATKTLVGYGNKGSNQGTLELFPDDAIKKEYVLLPDQVYDKEKSFAPCFEETLSEMDKAQDPVDTGTINTQRFNVTYRVQPNPFSDKIQVFGNFPREKMTLYDALGKSYQLTVTDRKGFLEIHTAHVPSGVYILKVGHEAIRLIKP